MIARHHNHNIPDTYENFRQASCRDCNIKFQAQRNEITVICHSGAGYDWSLILSSISSKYKISVLATSSEKYICLKIGCFRFIDSYKFLNASLADVVSSLPRQKFHHLRRFFGDRSQLLFNKGYFCYSYLDGWGKMRQPLPKREAFYNDLTEKHLTKAQYKQCETVYNAFKCKNLLNYLSVYLYCDVLHLADVFENFRVEFMETYNLDPVNYCTIGSLSMDAMLSHSGVKLETIQDMDIYQWLETSIIGGICNIGQRYAKANHPGVPDYNPKLPTEYLFYGDLNQLYPSTFLYKMPIGEFQWIDISIDEIMKVDPDGDYGYFLEVDFHYPESIHEETRYLPLAPHKVSLHQEMMSPYQKENFPPMTKAETKLCLTMYDKANYILHHRTLILYVQLGLVITKIHRVLKFKQAHFLRDFFIYNNALRRDAIRNKNHFRKALFKSVLCNTWGKFIENPRKYILLIETTLLGFSI